jgi:hypothetical protein
MQIGQKSSITQINTEILWEIIGKKKQNNLNNGTETLELSYCMRQNYLRTRKRSRPGYVNVGTCCKQFTIEEQVYLIYKPIFKYELSLKFELFYIKIAVTYVEYMMNWVAALWISLKG